MSKKNDLTQKQASDPKAHTQPPTDKAHTKATNSKAHAEKPPEEAEAPAVDADEAIPPGLVDLRLKVASLEERLANTRGQYKDALDDFEATKARLRRDVARDIDAGKKTILTELLEVLDNLERALETSDDGGDSAGLRSGVMMVRDQFLLKLEAQGVRRVAAKGQVFDPSCFEAISAIPVSDVSQDGIVLSVVRDAYRLGNDVLRPGMVAVGKHAETSGG